MRFLFDDTAFSFRALRTAGHEGDEEAWSGEWTAVAERLHRIGDAALVAGHRVSAREAYLRASNYYRTADFFRVEDRESDAESDRLAGNSLADGTGRPLPTVIHHGYDSTLEELYSMVGAGALRRGYHVLAFEGPGQQSVRREQGPVFRPDADPEKLVLIGTSFGGLLAARAAAFEDRLAACVLHNGIHDFCELPLRAVPPFLGEWVTDGRDDVASPALAVTMAQSTRVRWFLRHGMWVFGVKTPAEALRACAPYHLGQVAEHISCATLVLDAEHDAICCGEAQRVHDAPRCEKDLMVFTAAEGAGEHCQEGAVLRFHQRVFDWLDERLGRP